jgi:hypothetical protein
MKYHHPVGRVLSSSLFFRSWPEAISPGRSKENTSGISIINHQRFGKVRFKDAMEKSQSE